MSKKEKTLLEKAMESQGKKDRIVSMKKGSIDAIHIVEGRELKATYDTAMGCMTCDEGRLGSGQSGGCPVCDGLMTAKEYTEFENKFKEAKKPQPKITKPEPKEPSKYPLETIKVNRDNLTLTQAKQVVLEDIELYNFTIEHIVNDKDYIQIGSNKHLCKSGVRKIQLALNISTEIISNEVWKEDEQWIAKYIVKAIAPSGRFATAVGVCEQFEKNRSRTRHDTEATAQTRASSRAIMDLVGFGAVSSTEIDDSLDVSGSGDLKNAFGG